MKLALVTGGTRGIGASLSRAFQSQGYRVVANYHCHDDHSLHFQSETHIPTLSWDVSDPNACEESVSRITKEYGEINVLVNNAGICDDAPLSQMTIEQWQRVIDVNLNGVFYMTRTVMDAMCKKGFGRIITIGSINGYHSAKDLSNYSASKAGVVGLMHAIAHEGGPYGVTANMIAPGYIRTGLADNLPTELLEKIMKSIPLKRFGIPEEVAAMAVFLASPAASFMTGTTLHINGGQWMN